MATATDTTTRPMADDELLIVRTLDAPVALVWRIWESREHAMRWWGPKAFTCAGMELDFRPGGAWRACIASPTYGDKWMGGVYREIVRERKLVFTFAWEAEPDLLQASVITVTFEERDGKTVQTFHQTGFTDVPTRDSHVGGWSSFIESETAYAETLARETAR
jgi:uncharacterized protein YndB with AHSA1/START domain